MYREINLSLTVENEFTNTFNHQNLILQINYAEKTSTQTANIKETNIVMFLLFSCLEQLELSP